MRGVTAITYDFWNTLFGQNPKTRVQRAQAYGEILESAGFRIAPDAMTEAIEAGWQWYNSRWRANQVSTAADGVDAFLAALAIEVPASVHQELEEFLLVGPSPEEMVPAPQIGDTLEALKLRGIRLGIICDVGFTPSTRLREYLAHYGLLGHFDHWTFSDEVGVFKPDAQMFRHASQGLGSPEFRELAHVGDIRRTDVAGARAQGWTSVRYSELSDDQTDHEEADLVIATHLSLLDHLD